MLLVGIRPGLGSPRVLVGHLHLLDGLHAAAISVVILGRSHRGSGYAFIEGQAVTWWSAFTSRGGLMGWNRYGVELNETLESRNNEQEKTWKMKSRNIFTKLIS